MVNTYKCPGCGESLEYRPGAGELVCEYCGTLTCVPQYSQTSSPAPGLYSKDAPQPGHLYVFTICPPQPNVFFFLLVYNRYEKKATPTK